MLYGGAVGEGRQLVSRADTAVERLAKVEERMEGIAAEGRLCEAKLL